MAHINIFQEDAFGLVELSTGLQNIPYRPSQLRMSGLFQPRPLRQQVFGIEIQNGTLSVIPFSEQGGPAEQGNQDGRDMLHFATRHFQREDKIWASEVSGIRAFGTESELQQVMNEVAARGQRLRNAVELTHEFHMLNALKGWVLQPGTNAVVYNWYQRFNIAEPDPIYFDLSNNAAARGTLRKKCDEVSSEIEDALAGLVPGEIVLEARCGKGFWRDLTSNKDIMEVYLYAQKVAESTGRKVTDFEFGDITWKRYRGGSGVGLADDECVIYPVGIPDLFLFPFSPALDFNNVNRPGLDHYFRIIPDQQRNQYVQLECESNPMYVCTRPQALRRGLKSAAPG